MNFVIFRHYVDLEPALVKFVHQQQATSDANKLSTPTQDIAMIHTMDE